MNERIGQDKREREGEERERERDCYQLQVINIYKIEVLHIYTYTL